LGMKNIYTDRIEYSGDIEVLIKRALEEYNLGTLVEYRIIEVGYEDLNIHVETVEGHFFFKFFVQKGDYAKSLEEMKEYVKKMEEAIKTGVRHPKLIKNIHNTHFTTISIDKQDTHLCIQEFIQGKSITDISSLGTEDLIQIGENIAKLHTSKFKPEEYYDMWAIVNFIQEFERKKRYLEEQDLISLKQLYTEFKNVEIESLPHRFIHADIIKTNMILGKDNKIYIFDFSVAAYGPRIVEFALIACSITFDPGDLRKSKTEFKTIQKTYSKYHKLTPREKELFPLFTKIGHAMHILISSYEIAIKKEYNEEDYYWRDTGRAGLRSMG